MLKLSVGKWSEGGAGVKVYFLDTGINVGHELFHGKARNFGQHAESPYAKMTQDDVSNHGTGVAGVVHSIAPEAELVNVKIEGINPHGWSRAVNDIITQHVWYRERASKDPQQTWRGSVINLTRKLEDRTLPGMDELEQAFRRAAREGIGKYCPMDRKSKLIETVSRRYSHHCGECQPRGRKKARSVHPISMCLLTARRYECYVRWGC